MKSTFFNLLSHLEIGSKKRSAVEESLDELLDELKHDNKRELFFFIKASVMESEELIISRETLKGNL